MTDDVFDAIGEAGKTLTIIIFGGIAFGALFVVAGGIVHNSGNEQLQITYSATEPIVSNVSYVPDWGHFIKTVLIIVGLPVGGYLGIKLIREL